MHEHLRHQLLGWWAGVVCDHPRLILLLAAMLTAASLAVAISDLAFRPDRNALISDNLAWNRRYIDYRRSFSFDDLLTVVAVPDAEDGLHRARRFVDDLATRLRRDSLHFSQVVHGFEGSPRLLRLAPMPPLRRSTDRMRQSAPLLRSTNSAELLTAARTQMATTGQDTAPEDAARMIERMTAMVSAIGGVIEGEDPSSAFVPLTADQASTWQYLTSEDGRLLFVQIKPHLAEDELEPVRPAVAAARKIIARVLADHPGIEAGVTGVPVIESDETDVARRDATLTSILAVIAIAAILILAFHGWQMPLVIVASLSVGIVWTFGFLTLAIGYLQILSVVFTVILLGLGVDFGIHLISRFELVRALHPSGPAGFRDTMVDTLQVMGPGIVTGAVTTAVAFGATLLTDFRGMAEMGLIAGVGILLCLTAMFAVLPAIMRLTRPRRRHVTPVHRRPINLYEHRWWQPFVDRPALPLTLVGAALIVAVFSVPNIRYDYNLSNLLPEGVDSVRWFRVLEADAGAAAGGQGSIWFGASIVRDRDLVEAKRRTKAFRAQPSVAGVGGAGWLYPPHAELREQVLAETRAALGEALGDPPPTRPADRAAMLNELRVMSAALAFGSGMVGTGESEIRAAMEQLSGELQQSAEALEAMDAETADRRLAALHEAFTAWRGQVRRAIALATDPSPLQIADLPEALRRQSVGGPDDRLLLLQVYPKNNVYEPANLEQFVGDLRKVDPGVTGTVVQIYESNQLIIDAYIFAGLMALAAVFLLVLVDFQSAIDALMCLVPVAVAFVLLMGVMAAVNVTINPANVIVLPLLFGIGVDCGVHMLHRYRQSPDEHPPGLAGGTGKGITLTSLTTMIGFASLMLARHRGIVSLGFVLAMGMALTLLTCLAVMPALLELRNKLARILAARRR